MSARERVQLTFECLPDPDNVPTGVRLRHLLKHALRQLYLKCVRVEDLPCVEQEQGAKGRTPVEAAELPDASVLPF